MWVYCVRTGTSDLAGQLVAALASSAMVFREKDLKYSNKLMGEAMQLYAAANRKRGKWSDKFIYPCAPPVRVFAFFHAPDRLMSHMLCLKMQMLDYLSGV